MTEKHIVALDFDERITSAFYHIDELLDNKVVVVHGDAEQMPTGQYIGCWSSGDLCFSVWRYETEQQALCDTLRLPTLTKQESVQQIA